MAFTEITAQFREVVARSSHPGSAAKKKSAKHADDAIQPHLLMNKEYLKEAYNVLAHISNLTQMLSSIRKPYLNVDANASTSLHRSSRTIVPGEQEWSTVRYLTDEERDQVDLQTRVILSKCSERVKAMEETEKKRGELASKDTNLLTRFLPTRLMQGSSSAVFSANLAAHHASITYYLNRKLTEASQFQKDMQEERIKRQLERSRTLGSSAALEVAMRNLASESRGSKTTQQQSWLGGLSSLVPDSATAVLGQSHQRPSQLPMEDEFEDDDDNDIELSSSQIQQFEKENANILQSVQDTLASVQQAESRLMEISALQMELVTHLTQQTEMTEQLYEDAVATSATVDRGNVQLKEAKRRAKDSRLYILIFLFGASFALLFLHYY